MVFIVKNSIVCKRVGHVFHGRYKTTLVEKDSYLLELARYIVLNPVKARMVQFAEGQKWSSYRETIDESKDLSEIPASQRRSIPKSLEYYSENMPSPNAAIISAYTSGRYSMKEVGEYFGLSCSMVSRIIKYSKIKT